MVAVTHTFLIFLDLHSNNMLRYVTGVTSYVQILNVESTDKEKYFEALGISASISLVPITHKSVGISPWY